MPMPSYVPVDDINNMMCTTNWTQMIDDIVSMYDVMGTITEVIYDNYSTFPNTTTSLCLSQAMIWSSYIICCGLFCVQ
jgi:hypothetical protein